MTPATVPPESFRISAAGWWFLVHIAETVEEMRTAMRAHVTWCHPEQLGCVVTIRGASGSTYENCCGFLFLPKSHLGAGLVAHELAHAAFRICDAAGLRVTHWEREILGAEPTSAPSEETYCSILETLSQEFWVNVYAHGYAKAE